jgi:hypothetical protein
LSDLSPIMDVIDYLSSSSLAASSESSSYDDIVSLDQLEAGIFHHLQVSSSLHDPSVVSLAATILIESYKNSKKTDTDVSKNLCALGKLKREVEQVLKDTNVKKKDSNEVLVGGSIRIFGGELSTEINPNMAVTYFKFAAVQARSSG